MSIDVTERKKLWGLSRNQCAFDQCATKLIDSLTDADGTNTAPVVIGEEAHIRSGRPGGPRYDEAYDPALIDNYENLILLCPNHHTQIDKDNGRGFSVRDLVEMRRGHEQSAAKDDRRQRVYAAYLAQQWTEDNRIRFEAVDLDGPSVDSMFVDVPVAAPASSRIGAVIAAVAAKSPVDLEARDETEEFEVAGGAQVLLSPLWQGNALIQGGPGQGKSTLLQYVCQYHRSRLIVGKDDQYTGSSDHLQEVTTVARIPIRVDLRHLAAWLRSEADVQDRGRRNQPSGSHGTPPPPPTDPLAVYLAQHIATNSGMKFSVKDLAAMLGERSVLLALDGLDEIASLGERERTSEVVVSSVSRLQANATDLVALVATRPGVTDTARWADAEFTLMRLRPLSLGLKVQYLSKWCSQAAVKKDRAADLQTKLIENQTVPHVRELGSNPMQLAILLHLLHRRGLLPQQRTELYREYVKTFLDREEQGKEPLLNKHRQAIIDIHAYLAWYLQSRAETDQNTDGTVSKTELQTLIRQRLSGSTEGSKFAQDLIAAMTSRVLCLVERHKDQFEFEVQSLREYFAALYIFDEAPPRGGSNSRDDCLSALLERPYWSNVLRFMVGMLSKGEVKALVENFRTRQDTTDARLDPYLRWIAVQILDDRIYETQDDKHVAQVVDFILDAQGAILGEDGLLNVAGLPVRLAEGAGAQQAIEHARSRLMTTQDDDVRRSLAMLLQRHMDTDANCEWAWSAVSQTVTESQLYVLAYLGAFRSIGPAQTSRLAEAFALRKPGSSPTNLELLVRGRYDGADGRLIALGLTDVLNGLAEQASPQYLKGIECPLRTLVSLGRIESLAGLARLTPDRNGFATSPRRQRSRAGEPIAAHANVLTAWFEADHRFADQRTDETWKTLVAAIRGVQADSWLLRVALTYAALEVDLTLGADPSLAADATWRSHAAWSSAATQHANDPEWWKNADRPTDHLPLQQWLLGVFGLTSAKVLTSLLPALEEPVNSLGPREFEALQIAVERVGNHPGNIKLVLSEALRRGLLKPGPRTAALLASRCEAESATRLWKTVVKGLLPISGTGEAPGVVLRNAINWSESMVDIKTLKGTRSLLWIDSVHNLPKRPMAINLARDILSTPEDWPRDVVVMAAQRLALKRTSDLPPIATVANADGWFAEE